MLRAISRAQTDAQPVFDIIAASAFRLCGAAYGSVQLYDGEMIHMAALENVHPEGVEAIRAVFPMRPDEGTAPGRAIRARSIVQIPDVLDDSAYELKSELRTMGFRSLLAVPMLRDGEPVGTIVVGRPEPGLFSDKQIDLLQTFADQAVIAIENVRLFTELEARNRALTESLEQQTATSTILQVISSSPTDVQPVFETIIESAVRLCDGLMGAVFQYDGELIQFTAGTGFPPAVLDQYRRSYPRPLGKDRLLAPAILGGRPVNVPDVLERARSIVGQAELGFRSALYVPIMREGTAVGVIAVGRRETGAFLETQVKLLQTFADQAVIAIENVRLFKELEARNAELTETLARQTATGEVLRAISRAPDRRAAGVRHHRGERAPAMRRQLQPGCSSTTASSSTWRPSTALIRSAPRRCGAPIPCGPMGAAAVAGRSRRVRSYRFPTCSMTEPMRSRARHRPPASAASLRFRCCGTARRSARSPSAGPSRDRSGQAGRAARDLRRPGGDRHRERAAVQGAAGAERRADRLARPADGHG